MLTKYFRRAAITATVLACTAGAAFADQFEIVVTENAFFPETSVLKPGDQVTFINQSGFTRSIAAIDGSWVIEDLGNEGQAILEIVADMPNEYVTLDSADTPEDNAKGMMEFSGQVSAD